MEKRSLNKNKKRTIVFSLSLFLLFAIGWLELYLQKKQNSLAAGFNKIFLFLLINAHVIISLVLFYLIIRQSIKLFIERKQKAPGSIFKRNLVFSFIVFSTVPTIFISFTATKLITTSMDHWFHGRIGTGLQNGLGVHEHHTKQQRDEIQTNGNELANRLKNTSYQDVENNIKKEFSKNKNFKQYSVYYFGVKNNKLFGSIKKETKVWRQFRQINDRSIKSLKTTFFQIIQTHKNLEHVFDFFGSLYWTKKIILKNSPLPIYIVFAYRYPKPIRQSLIELQKSNIDYEYLKSMKYSLYWNYFATFILFTLLIVFLSIWCAFYLAKGISKPIQNLFAATEKVRRGILNVTISEQPSSDMQKLIVGFNEMTKTIQAMYTHLELKNHEQATILENINESVFFINNWGRILTFNAASKDLIQKYLKLERFKNKKISFLKSQVTEMFFSIVRELKTSQETHLTKEITFNHEGEQRCFIAHTSIIKIGTAKNEQGLLVIIEDLTDLLKMNKIKTWQEAAKQMAHEIKNPLTPIQLATQRLKRKLTKEYGENQIVTECTNTILDQVSTIKNLVAHFLEFAQMPEYKVAPVDINKLIKEVIHLYEMSYHEVSFTTNLQDFIPDIKADSEKIRRVFINLLDNSIRAMKSIESQEKTITIKSFFKPKRNHIELLISDNGPGIPRDVKEKLFLPYVSTSSKNMGLGLAIVHEIISQAGGTIKLVSSDAGTTFQIVLPV